VCVCERETFDGGGVVCGRLSTPLIARQLKQYCNSIDIDKMVPYYNMLLYYNIKYMCRYSFNSRRLRTLNQTHPYNMFS